MATNKQIKERTRKKTAQAKSLIELILNKVAAEKQKVENKREEKRKKRLTQRNNEQSSWDKFSVTWTELNHAKLLNFSFWLWILLR